eukprot:TRINITY_DN874_c0_g2_i1.p1 TRINITY_DN874_c0_g2~~TRINITY_DN874_c0_g2_i1.p1  ORF type:complete len:654 (+),score=143.49 TRINITY_DN874_c0_g2_i1:38-1999(+)
MSNHSWNDFGLDDRIKKAILKLKWFAPTPVQALCILNSLKGKDVLTKAKTGSGKTGAFAIPVVQRILSQKDLKNENSIKALILAPSTELCEQIRVVFTEICFYSSHQIRILRISPDESLQAQEPRLGENPDILIATPGTLVKHLQRESADLSALQMLVIDEADLILSYGHKADIQKIKTYLPSVLQSFMMSATLSDDVTELKNQVLHNPVLLELKEVAKVNLKQNVIHCDEKDKFLLIYVLLKLKLVPGKTIIFVNDIERCFWLKLFFERFNIQCAVLNSELPQNSRVNIIKQFNKGLFDLLIATEETNNEEKKQTKKATTKEPQQQKPQHDDEENDDEDDDKAEENVEIEIEKEDEEDEEEEEEEEETPKEPKKKTRKTKGKKKEEEKEYDYDMARGIDFQGVANVINFDFPCSPDHYTHRVGRTARAGRSGVALSFVTPGDEALLEQVSSDQRVKGLALTPYAFKMSTVEGFRYRVEDVLGTITKKSIKTARSLDIKNELVNSAKLKSYFEENPSDLNALQHIKILEGSKVRPHLTHLPFYLVPSKSDIEQTLAPVPEGTNEEDRIAYDVRLLKNEKRQIRAAADPLKYFGYGKNRSRKRKFAEFRDTITEKTSDIPEGSDRKKAKKGKKKPKRRDKMPKTQFKSAKPRAY